MQTTSCTVPAHAGAHLSTSPAEGIPKESADQEIIASVCTSATLGSMSDKPTLQVRPVKTTNYSQLKSRAVVGGDIGNREKRTDAERRRASQAVRARHFLRPICADSESQTEPETDCEGCNRGRVSQCMKSTYVMILVLLTFKYTFRQSSDCDYWTLLSRMPHVYMVNYGEEPLIGDRGGSTLYCLFRPVRTGSVGVKTNTLRTRKLPRTVRRTLSKSIVTLQASSQRTR